MRDGADAFRQFEVGNVNRVADVDARQVDLNEFRQVLWQAGDIQIGQHVADNTGMQLHSRRNVGVDKVQRHLDVNLLRGVDTLEVDVQHELLIGVQLEVAQQNLFCLAVDFRSRIDEWNTSFFNAWYNALWSSAMFSGAVVPP